MKTIVAPFLSTRLTSPGSPRMESTTIRKKKKERKEKKKLENILQLGSSRELYAAQ